MKTDVIIIRNGGEGIDKALLQTDKVAVYKGLPHKQALRLRLLAEEMTGMLRAIIGDMTASFWIETEAEIYELHLSAMTVMDGEKREALLQASSSGRNEAAKGFMGRLWDIFMRMSEPKSTDEPGGFDYGYVHTDLGSFEAPMGVEMHSIIGSWSLNNYRKKLDESREDTDEDWDELEKSIVAKLADEVKVFINGNAVEMVIYASFANA